METFEQKTPSDFFYDHRDLAGFGTTTRAIYTAVRELVENSLDAGDREGIPPDITISLKEAEQTRAAKQNGLTDRRYVLTVRDNGPGIKPQIVPKAFGTVLFGSKYGLKQARGMFGMGATMAILYGQITTGRPVVVESGTGGKKWHRFTLKLDIQHNRPNVLAKEVFQRTGTGLSISITLDGNYAKAGSKIRSYVRQTAIITPYASISYDGPTDKPEDHMKLTRSTSKMPEPPVEAKRHPHGTNAETLNRMIGQTVTLPQEITATDLKAAGIRGTDPKKYPRTFKTNATRMTGALALAMGLPAADLVGCKPVSLTGRTLAWETAGGRPRLTNLTKEIQRLFAKNGMPLSKFLTRFQGVGPGTAKAFLKRAGFRPGASVLSLEDGDISELAASLNAYEDFRAPDPACLSPLGAGLLEAGMKAILEPDYLATLQRRPAAYSGYPFVVEVGLAYGGNIKSGFAIQRFSNRIPLLYDEGEDAMALVTKDICWKQLYGVGEDSPVAAVIHVCSTQIPYKSAGKESVGSRPEIDKEIRLGLQVLGRKLATHVRQREQREHEAKRAAWVLKYLDATAGLAAEITQKPKPKLEAFG